MKVSDVKWVEKKDLIDKRVYPYTFFELSPSEQSRFNSFRVKHDKLKGVLEGMTPQERGPLEKQVNQTFANLIGPYLGKHGMKIDMCFRTYGDEKDTLVTCNNYKLSDRDEPFDLSYEITHWFSTNSEVLSCRSHLTLSHSPISGILRDLVSRCTENVENDGKTSPIIYLSGAFIQFASIEFAVPIMKAIGGSLERIGKERVGELKVLHDAYSSHTRIGEEETIQRRVFREAYEQRLTNILIESGLMRGELEAVN